MFSQYEYLVRERNQELDRLARQAQESRVSRELSAQRRWHRVARYAQAAERRHAHRLHRAVSR